MSTSIHRRGTFVLSEPNSMDSSIVQSGIDKQNLMRLRINRIALIQEIRVEHVMRHLTDVGLINEEDREKIADGTTPTDRARILVDLLPMKGRAVDWYKCFRESLQNPDGGPDVRKRYKALVEFLDNTVIHRPTSQATRFGDDQRDSNRGMRLPYYQALPSIKSPEPAAQNILNLDDERKKDKMRDDEEEKGALDDIPEIDDKLSMWSHKFETLDSMTLVKGYFQQWVPTPGNYRSLIQMPDEHFNMLQKSSSAADREQMMGETKVLERMKKLELVAVLSRRKLLPAGFELCMCDIVQEILLDKDTYHMYFKYLKSLESSDVNLLQDILDSFYSILTSNMKSSRNSEAVKQFTNLAFNLIDFVTDYGYFSDAERIMSVLMAFLSESHELDIWMTKYKGFVKLMHLRNRNYDFIRANEAFNYAVQMTWQIKLMSFGQHVLDEGELNVELSTTLLELGSVNSAFSWSQNALKEVDPNNKVAVINALCNSVMSYCAKWQVKRAEQLAVQAVQLSKHYFGERHPLYLKALLHFSHYSSEFRQDEDGLKVAQFALLTAKKLYYCDTLQVAFAHRSLSKALLVMQKFDDDKYYFHATEALRIARNILPDDHPLIYIFLHTSASALQWKALQSSKEMQEATLVLAETEAQNALKLVCSHYGQTSMRAAQLYSLLGQIYSKMERLQQAEEMFKRCMSYMEHCQAPNSYFKLLAAATLGTFYKVIQKPKDAIRYLKDVVDSIESAGVYMRWVHSSFEHLIYLLQSMNKNKEADDIQIRLSCWLRDNPKLDTVVTLETLNGRAKTFTQFMQDFNIWGKRTKKIINFVKEDLDAHNDNAGKDTGSTEKE